MRVSTVCSSGLSYALNNFSDIDFQEQKHSNESVDNIDSTLNTFTSSPKKYDSNIDMDKIYEWKVFCQNKIMANDLDYLA